MAISGKAGTLGLGGELTTAISPNMNARIGINALDFDIDAELTDIEYEVGLDFASYSALIDWHVFDDSFRISGGIVSFDHKFSLDAKLDEDIDIGGGSYTPDEIGTLTGSVEFDDLAPYVGIGWGDTLGRNKRWGFYTDLGVAFGSSPDVRLSATGAGSVPGLEDDLAREEDDIQDKLDFLKYYPVLSVGLFYRF